MVTIAAAVLDMQQGGLRDLEEGVLGDGPLGRLHQLRH